MLACFYALCSMLASLVLGFSMLGALRGLDLVWLHLTPIRPCLDVTAWDASSWCQLFRVYPFPFHFVRCYAYHVCLRHSLAFYASLHACSHVHAWVLLASVSSMLQHNEVMDIWSKPTFVPLEHHLLFAFLLNWLLACLLACFLVCLPCSSLAYLVACHVPCHMLCLLHLCACLLYTHCTLSTHLFLSIACLLVSCCCLCMYTYGARMHGARPWSPRHKHKGADASM